MGGCQVADALRPLPLAPQMASVCLCPVPPQPAKNVLNSHSVAAPGSGAGPGPGPARELCMGLSTLVPGGEQGPRPPHVPGPGPDKGGWVFKTVVGVGVPPCPLALSPAGHDPQPFVADGHHVTVYSPVLPGALG